MFVKTIRASDLIPLDSNVSTGGGTDATAVLQAALDEALTAGGVHLLMDGAALISTLRVHSNTTIECLTPDCGFFQMPGTNRSLLTNADWAPYAPKNRHISLIGGTYNQDCRNQLHDVQDDGDQLNGYPRDTVMNGRRWVMGLEFYGVENLLIRDVILRDFRTFALTVGGFRGVTIENVWLDLPGRLQAQNQDGFHFWGPGRFLNVRGVGGRVGDDFMNIGPDERDDVSSITDVLVDGVFLDDADQAIRLLSHGTGRLDRVTIRNVTGTYRSFGFYINCWMPGERFGNFGNLLFENIDLRQTAPNYTYRPPFLFSVGGNMESLTVRNLRHHLPSDARALMEIGLPFFDRRSRFPKETRPCIRHMLIDGLTILEEGEAAREASYIQIFGEVTHLVLRDVTVLREPGEPQGGCLLSFQEAGHVQMLCLSDVFLHGIGLEENLRADRMIRENVTLE